MSRIIRALEKRDSLANPSKWLTLAFGGGTDTATGIRVNEVVALRNLTVMSCVNVISQTIAQLPLLIYARTGDGGRVRMDKHPLYRILDKQPNDRMTAFTLREVLQAHLLTWGNAYAYIERSNAGEVIGLYPLLPDRTRAQLDSRGNLIYLTRIKTDPQGTSSDDSSQLVLPAQDVLHIPGLGFDGLRGYSVIAQARESVGLGLALTEFAARFFGNGAIPGLVLTKESGSLSPEQRTMLREGWAEGHQGLLNASRIAILEGGLKVEKIGVPPEDAQFLESRKFSRNELAGIYRVPPHMIGDIERTTSWGTGIEQQAIGFLVYTMLPWFERWQQAINVKLFRRSEQDTLYCEFLPDALLRGDIQTRYAAYNLAFGKWMTGNMIAARENMPPLGPGGDQLYAPSGMVPLDENGDPQAPPATPDAPADQNEPSALAASAPRYDVRDARERLASAHEVALRDAAERILRRERADLVREAERGKLTSEMVDSFYEDHRAYVERVVLAPLVTYAESVRLLVENELGRSILASRSFDQFVRGYAQSFAQRHSTSSRSQLDGDLSAPALERIFGPSTRRAEQIAAYEATRAGNAFARALYREVGMGTVRWIARDEREECRALDGSVIPIGDRHPPLAEDCRCLIVGAEFLRAVDTPKDGMWLALEALASKKETPAVINVTTPPVTFTVADGAFRTEITVPERQVSIAGDTINVPERSVTVNSPTTIAEGAVSVPERSISVAPAAVQVDVHVPEDGETQTSIEYDKSGRVTGTTKRKKKS